MEEDYIHLHTGRLAKKAGFNLHVTHFYSAIRERYKKNYLTTADDYQTERLAESNWNNGYGSYPTGAHEVDCSAPTQALLRKWLRKEHNIDIQIKSYKKHNSKVYGEEVYYGDFLSKLTGWYRETFRKNSVYVTFDTYEEALEIALQNGLNIVISRKEENLNK